MAIVFVAVICALLAFWFHRRVVRATRMPRPWSIIVDVALVVLGATTVIGMSTGDHLDPRWARPFAFVGLTWLSAFLYFGIGLLLLGVISMVARLTLRFRTGDHDDPRRHWAFRGATAFVVVASVATVAYGVVEANGPRVTHVPVSLERLPREFDGVRVALVSDLHIGPARGAGFTRKVVDLLNAQRPDLIILAGDLTDGTVDLVADDLAPIADLTAPLGVFGTSGNHEFYADDGGRWLDTWDRLGVKTLRNERVELTRGGAVIDLAGIHDFTAPAPYEPDLGAALRGRDTDRFVLLSAHEPRQAEEASRIGVDLQLSGHTHGGQMWPIRYLVPLQQPSVDGLDRVGNTQLYTTRGAGSWGPPVRVGAPPEITMLELRRQS